MAARQYVQILDASDPDQSADDVFTIAAPVEILRGGFTLYYIPRDDSSYGSDRCLLSVAVSGGSSHKFMLQPDGLGATNLVVQRLSDEVYALVGPLTFSALQELRFDFQAVPGIATVSQATTGNGENNGFAWNLPAAQMRLGGDIDGADVARGYVSLPYALPTAELGDEGELPVGNLLDFSIADNSSLIALL